MDKADLIVIGGGLAGFTAGIYGVRAGLSTTVFTGSPTPSLLTYSSEVENFPGFDEPTPGGVIVNKIRKQAERLGTEVIDKAVNDITVDSRHHEKNIQSTMFKVRVGEEEYISRAVIIATGAKPRPLGVPGEQEFLGKGVSVCATCDGAFFKDKVVAVVGGGDSAAAEALHLSHLAKQVYIIHRRDTLRACQRSIDKIAKAKNIEVLTSRTVKEIVGTNKVEKLLLECCDDKSNGKEKVTIELAVDGVFVAIGYIPETELVKGKVELNEGGHIKTLKNSGDISSGKTSVPGLFAAGDVTDSKHKQAIVAAASGAIAALAAAEYLQNA